MDWHSTFCVIQYGGALINNKENKNEGEIRGSSLSRMENWFLADFYGNGG